MAKGFKHGGGSPRQLNFKIFGGTAAPENPKENTIWVHTDQPITGWRFRAERPEGTEGLVWIETGLASPVSFNALKKNGITLYPLSAWQYLSGTWVVKTAKSFQSGTWTDWLPQGAIYYRGSLMQDLTGGWTSYPYSVASGYTGSSVAVMNQPGHLEAALTLGGDYRSGFVSTGNPIDLTGCSSVEFEFEEVAAPASSLVALKVYSPEGNLVREGPVILSAEGAFAASGAVDVSSLTGPYRVGFMMWAQSAGVTITAKLKRAVLK